MILGMTTFTFVHVVISLIGIASGIVVVAGMCGGKRLPAWTALFLTSTVLTSVTGFMFRSATFGPPHVFGVISLAVLAIAIPALYVYRLAGAWRRFYIVGAIIALYLNVFVLVVQAFQKIPALHPLAPTQSEPPFLATQLVVLVLFIAIGVKATRSFHPKVTGRH